MVEDDKKLLEKQIFILFYSLIILIGAFSYCIVLCFLVNLYYSI